MDYQRLLDLTEDILTLRGGRGSGNWGHSGRKGKKGGSGRGGGLKRIGVEATIDKYEWTSDAPRVAQTFTNLLAVTPRSFDPNPDLTAAQEIVGRFGGEVVRFDKTPFDPKVIY